MKRVTVRDIVRNTKILGYGQELEITNNGETIGWFTPEYPSVTKMFELHGGKIYMATPPAKNESYEPVPQFPPHAICPIHDVFEKTCGCGEGGD